MGKIEGWKKTGKSRWVNLDKKRIVTINNPSFSYYVINSYNPVTKQFRRVDIATSKIEAEKKAVQYMRAVSWNQSWRYH